jgi:hypothetical protein
MTLDPKSSVREGRDAYLAENGFDMAAYTAPTFELPILGRQVSFPNRPSRQRAIARHDLHHAITGYGTDYAGEAEIGIWELRAGCNTAFLWFINLTAVALGLVIAPHRVWRAWRAAKGQRSLYLDERSLDELLDLPLGELRSQLGVRRDGVVVRAANAEERRETATA